MAGIKTERFPSTFYFTEQTDLANFIDSVKSFMRVIHDSETHLKETK